METNYNPNEQALALHGDRINDETREIQSCLLGILKAIDNVCREHHLRYYLFAGTMLGAVRHKGFVPWDDDADIAMPRPDYEEFLKHANEWLPERYELVRAGAPMNYPYVFARVQDNNTTYQPRRSFEFLGGLPVDVFPLDGMVKPGFRRWWHYFRYRKLWHLIYFAYTDPYKHGKGFRSFLTLAIRKIFPPLMLQEKIDQLRKEYDFETSSLVVDHDNRPEHGIVPKEVIGTPVPYEFADTTLMGVANPDAYLRCWYGNYMEIPKDIPRTFYRYLDLKKPWKVYVSEQKK
ncbi:phosphorylcholine transferase LicD [Prevotella sp. E2-28]|uniref:LicD family protein n=1 Tax=Prevotella sp. E2-28 TaxID=2913620 RepID=UPI001EDB6F7B|nr:LicD family protein [Prevotella sp. E2-28]UKK53543.1 LicD family protein [Prevotella sp. E2-28]